MKDKQLQLVTACASAGAMFMGSMGAATAETGPDRTTLPIREHSY
jgi:hypothetical protein